MDEMNSSAPESQKPAVTPSITPAPTPTPAPEAPKSDSHHHETPDAKDVEENKAIAVLSYIWILWIVPFLTKKESKFAQFHAKQGLVLFVAEVVISVVVQVIAVLTLGVGVVLFPLLALGSLILSIMGILNAWNGKMQDLPVVGNFAHKFFK